MFRVAIAYDQTRPGGVFRHWRVKKCYSVRDAVLSSTLPVKIDMDHGRDRRRLLLLTPYFVPVGQYHAPLEILRAYLLALPTDEKVRREAEAKATA